MEMTLIDALIVKTVLNEWHARRPRSVGLDYDYSHEAMTMLHRKADAILGKRCQQLFTEMVRQVST